MEHLEDAQGRSSRQPLGADLKKSFDLLWLRRELWLPWLFLLIPLALWEAAGQSGMLSALFFPSPSVIGQTLLRTIKSGDLLADLSATLWRLCLGLLIGGGLIAGWLVLAQLPAYSLTPNQWSERKYGPIFVDSYRCTNYTEMGI